jgi:hypothetical protein
VHFFVKGAASWDDNETVIFFEVGQRERFGGQRGQQQTKCHTENDGFGHGNLLKWL